MPNIFASGRRSNPSRSMPSVLPTEAPTAPPAWMYWASAASASGAMEAYSGTTTSRKAGRSPPRSQPRLPGPPRSGAVAATGRRPTGLDPYR